jgi:hypothetical protein
MVSFDIVLAGFSIAALAFVIEEYMKGKLATLAHYLQIGHCDPSTYTSFSPKAGSFFLKSWPHVLWIVAVILMKYLL